ncbi:esterase-like activity of phytase family protein [Microvirga massiliensis]|uniref:esterase-like activity of phytase family protein n=1 Tax=Microvirga massiliensis TaxID=1033741 RepID=UPI00062BF12D|nr:esterase-like activity of phytase family protein [Microvirga massiliensis]
MRLSRRSVLAGLAGIAVCGVAAGRSAWSRADLREPVAIEIKAEPLESLTIEEPEHRRFGELHFRSGLILSSPFEAFGGLSGLWRSRDGRSLVGITDRACWLTVQIVSSDGRLTGLRNAVMAPIIGASGEPLSGTHHFDTESLTIVRGVAYVGVERKHAVFQFPTFDRDGVKARARPVPLPVLGPLKSNQGLEAIGVIPAPRDLAGSLVAIAERVDDTTTRGFIITGPQRGEFEIVLRDGFDVTDLAFLDDGDMLLLERRFTILGGPAARIRRFPAGVIRPGATLDGPVLFESGAGTWIDNMEGMSVHREGSATIVTLVSDDNFSPLQRTLLLEFALTR